MAIGKIEELTHGDWRKKSKWTRDRITVKSFRKTLFSRSQIRRQKRDSSSRARSIRYTRQTASSTSDGSQGSRRFTRFSLLDDEKHLLLRTRTTTITPCDYHEDLKEDLEAGFTFRLLAVLFVVVFGSSFQYGYNCSVLYLPNTYIKKFIDKATDASLSDNQGKLYISAITYVFVVGGIVGSLLSGYLADVWGRRNTIIFSQVFTIIGAVTSTLTVVANAPSVFVIGRFFLGINAGIGNCMASVFLSEIAPFNLRGKCGISHSVAGGVGNVVAAVLGLGSVMGTKSTWQYLMLVNLLPALISLCALPFFPESPRFLFFCKRDRNGAEKALQFYRSSDDVTVDLEEMDTEDQSRMEDDPVKHSKTEFTVYRLLSSPELQNPLIVACMLMMIQQCCRRYTSSIETLRIFEVTGLPIEYVGIGSVTISVTSVVIGIAIIPLIETVGRRPLLLYPMCIMVVDLIILEMAMSFKWEHIWLGYLTVLCVIIFIICFSISLAPIPKLMTSELFRQGPRTLAMAAAGVSYWLSWFIVVMVLMLLKVNLGPMEVQLTLEELTPCFFIFVLIIFTMFIYLKVPETQGKTFEEIAHAYAPGRDIEVEEIIDDYETVTDDNQRLEDIQEV